MAPPTDIYHISYFKNQCGFCKKKIHEKTDDIYMYKYVFFILVNGFIAIELNILLLYHKYTVILLSVSKNVGKNRRGSMKKREDKKR